MLEGGRTELNKRFKLRRFRVVEGEESLSDLRSDLRSETGWTWDGSPEDKGLYCGLWLLRLGAAWLECPEVLGSPGPRRAKHMVRIVSEMVENLAGGIGYWGGQIGFGVCWMASIVKEIG